MFRSLASSKTKRVLFQSVTYGILANLVIGLPLLRSWGLSWEACVGVEATAAVITLFFVLHPLLGLGGGWGSGAYLKHPRRYDWVYIYATMPAVIGLVLVAIIYEAEAWMGWNTLRLSRWGELLLVGSAIFAFVGWILLSCVLRIRSRKVHEQFERDHPLP